MASSYAALEDRFRRLSAIDGALAVLDWDTAVIMPRGGSAARGEQMATLRRLAHDMLTAPATADDLAAAGELRDLGPWQQANLREMARRHRQAAAIDPALVEALARATNACEMDWRQARQDADFPHLLPTLREVLHLVREAARQEAAASGLTVYDTLLDGNQPDLRDAMLAPLFDRLAQALPDLIEAALTHQGPAPQRPAGPFPALTQKALGELLMARLGFDFDGGRLDQSTHPFCGGTPSDIRITTRYRDDEAVSALMGVLHETGHALYEGGLPPAWRGQPVGAARGMTVHESQSLLVEMQVCRSAQFAGFLAHELRAAFGPDPAFEASNLGRIYNRVERGFIRVDADELTYPLHVILRHRLERALIADDLPLADLPAAWNDGMRDLLGVVPPDDRRGCLQDIHWPVGAFGYFPNYTLGALLAAQLFRAARAQLPGLLDAIGRGDFTPLREWLRAKVHGRASFLPLSDLVREAAGAPLAVEPFLEHLRERYLTTH